MGSVFFVTIGTSGSIEAPSLATRLMVSVSILGRVVILISAGSILKHIRKALAAIHGHLQVRSMKAFGRRIRKLV